MAWIMSNLAKRTIELDQEERELLSDAYYNSINPRREALTTIYEFERQAIQNEQKSTERVAIDYRNQVDKEIRGICAVVLDLMEHCLAKPNQSVESQVFFYRMKGDYARYLAELVPYDSEDTRYQNLAEQAYMSGYSAAKENGLPATNPNYMRLVLSYAIFAREIKQENDKACALVSAAVEQAEAYMDNLDEIGFEVAEQNLEHVKAAQMALCEGANYANDAKDALERQSGENGALE